jgi:hypothetical protein
MIHPGDMTQEKQLMQWIDVQYMKLLYPDKAFKLNSIVFILLDILDSTHTTVEQNHPKQPTLDS